MFRRIVFVLLILGITKGANFDKRKPWLQPKEEESSITLGCCDCCDEDLDGTCPECCYKEDERVHIDGSKRNEHLNLNEVQEKVSAFNVAYVNARSLINETRQKIYNELLQKQKASIACVSESWLKEQHLAGFQMTNYELVSVYSRPQKRAGGVAVLLEKNSAFSAEEVPGFKELSEESYFEMTAVKFSNANRENVLLICIYRPPTSNNISTFLNLLSTTLTKANVLSTSVIVAGDMNLNLLKPNGNTDQYCTLTKSFKLTQLVKFVTRPCSGTLLDHIHTNINLSQPNSFTVSISDHVGIIMELK